MSVVVLDIRAKDNISPNMNRAKKSVEGFEKAVDKMQKKVDKMNQTQVKMMMEAYDRISPAIAKVKSELNSLTKRDWKIAMSIQLRGGLSGVKTVLASFAKGVSLPIKVELNKQDVKNTYQNLNRGNKIIQKIEGSTAGSGNNTYVNTQSSIMNGASGDNLSKQETGSSDSLLTNVTSYVGENILKPVANDYAKTLLKKGIGKIVGNAGNGTGLLGFGANTAIKLGAGNLAGGASLSPAALSAVGLGAVTGAVVGGATLVSGGMDLYKGFTSDNAMEAKAYKESGAWKLGGVAAGAAIGTMILPGAGTLIGAGIGGLAGWLASDKIKDDYYEKAKKDAEALALAEEQAKYKSQELKDALADSNMTAEEFGQKFQKVVGENFKNHFGKAQYSLEEMGKLMNKITFGNSIKSINRFSQASLQAKSDFNDFNQSVSNMDRQNWKISLGLKLSNSDKLEFQSSVDNFIQSSKKYIESKRYEATAAINVLYKGKKAKKLIASTDKTYEFYQERIDLNSKKLEETKNKALKYKKVPKHLKKEMNGYQKNIRKDVETLSNAENYASHRAMKTKYKDAALSSDSFQQLQGSSKEYVENAEKTYFEILKTRIESAKLKHDKDPEKFTKKDLRLEIGDAEKIYNDKVIKTNTDMTDFQLDTIVKSFFPMMKDNTSMDEKGISEYFKQILYGAVKSGEEPKKWDMETTIERFGLNDFIKNDDDRATVYERLFETIKSLPEHFENMLQDKDYIQWVKRMNDDMENIRQKLNEKSPSQVNINQNPTNETTAPQPGPAPQTTSALQTTPNNSVTEEDSKKNEAIKFDSEAIRTSCENVRVLADEYMATIFAEPFNVTTPVIITANYSLANPTAEINFSGGGSGRTTVNGTISSLNQEGEDPVKNALGGFPTGRQLSWICEEGPEAIIPLTPQRRQRALDLYEKTGRLLGANKVGKNAKGGLIGIQSIPDQENDEIAEIIPTRKRTAMKGEAESKPTIAINVDLGNNEFNISGSQNSEGVMSYIREHIAEIANEAGGEIAASLEEIFSNKPVTEGA